MGDVADILGLSKSGSKSSRSSSNKAKKPQGMNREVYSLLGTGASGTLPPIVPSSTPNGFNKSKISTLSSKQARKWSWTGFKNSARSDGAKIKHWRREAVVQNGNAATPSTSNDYAFARFNKKCMVVKYTDKEYAQIEKNSDSLGRGLRDWSKIETDHLFQLCERFDLRWFVIADKWFEYCDLAINGKPALRKSSLKDRSVTELKSRYYSIAQQILAFRQSKPYSGSPAPRTAPKSAPEMDVSVRGTPSKNTTPSKPLRLLPMNASITNKAKTASETALLKFKFPEDYEKQRIEHLTALFLKTKKEAKAEVDHLMEIKKIDSQIKRLQKELTNPKLLPKSAKRKKLGPSLTIHQTLLDKALGLDQDADNDKTSKEIISTRAGVGVYMRSERLIADPSSIGIGPRMLKKISQLVSELGVPERPLPTAAVMDSYDKLRQDALKLLTLQNFLQKRKAELRKLTLTASQKSASAYTTTKSKPVVKKSTTKR